MLDTIIGSIPGGKKSSCESRLNSLSIYLLCLDSVIDKKRIDKYAKAFNERVEWFKNNPDKLPSDFA